MPGSPWTSRWKFVLTVYVCAPADMHSAVDSFMEVCSVYVYIHVHVHVHVCVGGIIGVSMCSLACLHSGLSPCFLVLHS